MDDLIEKLSDLLRTLEAAREGLPESVEPDHGHPLIESDSSQRLFILLPARGASGQPTCPHCGKTITITLSK